MKEFKPEPIKYGVSAHCYKLMQDAGKDVSMFEVFQHIDSNEMTKVNLTPPQRMGDKEG